MEKKKVVLLSNLAELLCMFFNCLFYCAEVGWRKEMEWALVGDWKG